VAGDGAGGVGGGEGSAEDGQGVAAENLGGHGNSGCASARRAIPFSITRVSRSAPVSLKPNRFLPRGRVATFPNSAMFRREKIAPGFARIRGAADSISRANVDISG
jgi:hypothetical protein